MSKAEEDYLSKVQRNRWVKKMVRRIALPLKIPPIKNLDWMKEDK